MEHTHATEQGHAIMARLEHDSHGTPVMLIVGARDPLDRSQTLYMGFRLQSGYGWYDLRPSLCWEGTVENEVEVEGMDGGIVDRMTFYGHVALGRMLGRTSSSSPSAALH